MRDPTMYTVTERKFALKLKSGYHDGGVLPSRDLNVIPDRLGKGWVTDFT